MLIYSVFYFFEILIAVLLHQTKDVPTCILKVICYGFLERKENEKGSIYLQKNVEKIHTAIVIGHHKRCK